MSGWHDECRSRPRDNDDQRRRPTYTERAEEVVHEAEAARARIFDIQGKKADITYLNDKFGKLDETTNFMHSAMVDENYLLVAAHLEEGLQKRIIRGEYIDLSRLLPRDTILEEEENTMQMIVKNSQTFWRPARNFGSDPLTVNNVHRWEQAFRIYSDVYLRAHPTRAGELIQYNHIIHTTAATYVWENMYSYDKDFRLHMARFPNRNWGIILQQAWNFLLKEKLKFERGYSSGGKSNSPNGGKGQNEICKQFNRTGRCTFGWGCKYEHHCYYCGKIGNPIIYCRQFKYRGSDCRDRECDRD